MTLFCSDLMECTEGLDWLDRVSHCPSPSANLSLETAFLDTGQGEDEGEFRDSLSKLRLTPKWDGWLGVEVEACLGLEGAVTDLVTGVGLPAGGAEDERDSRERPLEGVSGLPGGPLEGVSGLPGGALEALRGLAEPLGALGDRAWACGLAKLREDNMTDACSRS